MNDSHQKAELRRQRILLSEINFSAWHPDDVFNFVEQNALNHKGDYHERGWAKKAILDNPTIWDKLTSHQAVYIIEHLQFDKDMIEKDRYAYREKPIYGSSALDHFLKGKPSLEALYKAKREDYKPPLLSRFWNGYNLSIPRPLPTKLSGSINEKRPSPSIDEKGSIRSFRSEKRLWRSSSSRMKI